MTEQELKAIEARAAKANERVERGETCANCKKAVNRGCMECNFERKES